MDTLLHLYYVTKPTRVIPTGITCIPAKKVPNKSALKKKSHMLTEFPELKNKRILFFAGRIGKEKNIEFLIEVLSKLKKSFPDLVLVITGDGPAKQDLVDLVKSKKLSDRIIFTGFIEKSRLNDLYSLVDIFVFASMVESQGLVVLEAMACGTPVVAIGKMGTREVMSGDNGGFMVDDDLEIFTEKVELLLSNKKVYTKKVQEALDHADKWRIEHMADRLEATYLRMIQKNSEKR
jgi:hypothetical protein